MRKLIRRGSAIEEQKIAPVKKRTIVRYVSKQCAFIKETGFRCEGRTTGNHNVCALHGGVAPKRELTVSGLQTITAKYDPSYHPMAYIMHSKDGLAKSEICGAFQISLSTLHKWGEKFKEFAEAMEIGKALHEAWYLRTGKDNLDSRFFQTGLFKFLTMNNGLNWSDKAETKSTQNGNFGVLLVPAAMGIDEWEAANIKEDEEMEEARRVNALKSANEAEA